MKKVRWIVIATAAVCALALAGFALAHKAAEPAPSTGPVIIIKGGSLSIECPGKVECLKYNAAEGKYNHKEPHWKITQIVVKDESGNVRGTFDSKDYFPNGKPSIEITYK
jgi:hypothetical protein